MGLCESCFLGEQMLRKILHTDGFRWGSVLCRDTNSCGFPRSKSVKYCMSPGFEFNCVHLR